MDLDVPQNSSPWARIAGALALAACAGYAAAALILAPVIRVTLDSGYEVVVFRSPFVQSIRWALVGLGAILAGAGGLLSRRRAMLEVRWLRALAPLAWLPAAGVLALTSDLIPPVWTACVVFIVAAAAAGVLSRLLGAWFDRPEAAGRSFEWTLPILVGSTLAYAALGTYLSRTVGEHLGDEGHYLTQAQSLYEDHDLDLQNDVMVKSNRPPPKKFARKYTHISKASRNGHWYSYHPYGLPFLLAPGWGLGVTFRYLVLGFLGGLANAGAYALARACGAGRRSALAATLCLGVTFTWAVYAARALPETLGAALLAWLFWSVVRQRERPWLTAVVGAACAGLMVVSHERFIPLSLMGFGFYGLFGLGMEGRWPAKIGRLSAFTAMTFAGFGVYVASQFLLYRGGLKVPPGNVLLAYPAGMWGAFADERGLASLMPSAVWFAAAMLWWPLRRRADAPVAAALMTTVAVAVVTGCSNSFYTGGSCVPGRYLVAVLPLAVPAVAHMLEATHAPARTWLLFLTLVSTAWLVLTCVFLEPIGRGFILPMHNLTKVHPYLAGLVLPHASFRYACPPDARLFTTLMVVGATVATMVVFAAPRRLAGMVTALAATAVAALVALAEVSEENRFGDVRIPADVLARHLPRTGDAKPVIQVPGATGDTLLRILRVPFAGTVRGRDRVGVTTRDLGVPRDNMILSQPRMDSNDWAGRGYRWATLNRPAPPQAGPQLLHIDGAVDGAATVVLALREGARTIFEGALPVRADGTVGADILLRCNGRRGDFYLLARLEGEGTFRTGELYWTPWSDALAESAGATLPADTIRTDMIKRTDTSATVAP